MGGFGGLAGLAGYGMSSVAQKVGGGTWNKLRDFLAQFGQQGEQENSQQVPGLGNAGIGFGLSAIPVVGPALSAAYGLASAIAPLFKKSPLGINKIEATRVQEQVMARAQDIEKQVAAGTLSPSDAARMLQSLKIQMAGLGGNEFDQRAALIANQAIDQILANLSGVARQKAMQPFKQLAPGATEAGAQGENMVPSANTYGGQLEYSEEGSGQFMNALRNALAGMPSGEQLKGTQFWNMLHPANPTERFGEAYKAVGDIAPAKPSGYGDFMSELRKKLGGKNV